MKTGIDPRASVKLTIDGITRSVDLHKPSVSFEEYIYYTSITREEEKITNEE